MADQSRLEIVIDSRGAERNVRNVRGELAQLERGGVQSLGNLRSAAMAVTGALAAIGVTTGVANSLRQIADFEAAMNGLAAVSGATADEMVLLERQARSLGATSQFSAQQAAEAQRFLAQAGFEVNEALGATPGILQLATAGSLDLASAADIASNVLGGMRLEVDQLSRVNDVLAATAARSNTSIEQLGQALSFAAPFAAGAGVSIEEASAAVGVLSDAGIQASRAGTGLVGVIRQLSRITPAAEKALKAAGLSAAQVSIEALGLETVLQNLAQANLDTAAAIEIFGSEAGAAAQVLINDYRGGIQDAEGEASRMATTLDQGLTPAFKSLGSAISESVLQMGDSGLSGGLERVVRSATGVISVFNGMEREWAAANNVSRDYVDTLRVVAEVAQVAALAVGGRLVVALGQATAAKIAAAGAATTLVRALALLGGPAGVAIIGAAALFTFRERLTGVTQAANATDTAVRELAEGIDMTNRAAIEGALIQYNAELFELESQARRAREEIDRLQGASRTGGALGLDAGQTGAQVRAQQELATINTEITARQQMQERLTAQLAGIGQQSDDVAEGAETAADSLRGLGDTADRLVQQFRPMLTDDIEGVLDRAGPGARIDETGTLRDMWGNTLPTLQRELDAQLQDQIRNFESEQNLMRGLEAAAAAFTEKATDAVNQAWANAPGLLPTGEQDGAPALAQPRSVGSLTFKLEGPNGGRETEVEGDADDLRRLADLFSGVAAAV